MPRVGSVSHRPRRRAVAAVALWAFSLGALLLLCAAPAAPRAFAAGGTGQIDGNVLNGTTGGKPLAGQSVALTVQIGAGRQQLATTVTDAAGNFHFTGLPTDQQDIYQASVVYQGATYTSDTISLAGDPHPAAITVLAYDATSSDARVGIGRVTVLFEKPTVASGTIRVVELLTMVNAGNQTFVGQTGPSGGMPMGLLRFALPANYANLVPQDGFSGSQIIQVNRGFASMAPVLPGESQFSFSFTYPYDGTRSVFTYEATYPTVQVVILVPSGVAVSVPGSRSLGTVSASGSKMQVWQVGPLSRAKTATISLSGLPLPGEKPTFDSIWLDILGGLLALVALALVVWYLRRSDSSGNMSSAPTATSKVSRLVPDAKSDDLLRALARLDRDHDAGAVEDLAYRVQRDALKSELKERLLQGARAAGGELR